MSENRKLEERVEKLERELNELRQQVFEMSKLLNEENDRKTKRRSKPQIVVGPSERIRLPEIKRAKPRPGDPQCVDESHFC